MTGGSDNGGGGKPRDDRTLLDPLSHDELKALREARQRMQAKRAQKASGGSAVKHQIVVGADPEPAPPPRKSALPTFDGNVTLDQISAPKGARPAAPDPAAPTSETDRTVLDPPAAASGPSRRTSSAPETSPSAGPTTDPSGPPPAAVGGAQGPKAGQTGFGENTLLWMQPVKPPPAAVSTAPTAADVAPTEKPSGLGRLKAAAAVIVALGVFGALGWVLMPRPRGTLELHTNPPGAMLYIDGELQTEKTPLRLNLFTGAYELRFEKDGYESSTVPVQVGEGDERKDIDLTPVSRAGLMTVAIEMNPVAGRITVDGKVHEGVRKVQIPNLDPSKEHRIRVEAGGYLKTEQIVPPGELKSNYSFSLEAESD